MTEFGVSDPSSTLLCQVKPTPPYFRVFTETQGGATLVFFDEHEKTDMTAYDLRYLLNQKEYVYREHIGDWRSGNQRDSSGFTWIRNLARKDVAPFASRLFGAVIHPGPPITFRGRRTEENKTITNFQTLLSTPGALAVSKKGCPGFIRALQNWSFPVDSETHLPLTDSSPKHDRWSHACKAGLYIVDWLHSHPDSDDEAEIDWNFSMQQPRYL